MFKHVYPPWHKTAQRCLFVIAAILCITLPVVYGKHKGISSKTLGAVLGVFFALWLVFSLAVRFLVPSPRVESSLPVYTHSPIPVPVVLHTPTRSNALPSSPAIRLHPSTAAGAAVNSPPAAVTKGARFADAEEAPESPSRPQNNVSFQTRPRGNTTDSTNSQTYPTFAAYRQAQHVNFDAFAQRVKRAFALSQQQQEQQKELRDQEEALKQQEQGQQQQQQQQGDLYLRPTNPRQNSSSSVVPAPASTGTTATGTRSRSASAASMIGDFAERIKNGTLFRRPSVLNSSSSVVADGQSSYSNDAALKGGQNSNSAHSTNGSSTMVDMAGIEITVTASEDDHPQPGNNGSEADAQPPSATTTGAAFDPASGSSISDVEPTRSSSSEGMRRTATASTPTTASISTDSPTTTRPRSNTRESSPLAQPSNVMTHSSSNSSD
ncbi:hypothetical protein BGZ70_007767 [Mortierella alpina]|uniref:Uncharacterized protein n=1 Tax=Mortierella alpina TaxID=64518 RepID=A0A9P6JE60_MORAP|nr:hypothetical protein BGZ70_007767 [Mortierella alpina]